MPDGWLDPMSTRLRIASDRLDRSGCFRRQASTAAICEEVITTLQAKASGRTQAALRWCERTQAAMKRMPERPSARVG